MKGDYLFFTLCLFGLFVASNNVCVAAPATYNIKDYGAVGDGKTDNTKAITAAITACNKAGGGQVVVPSGNFVTLPFSLLSNVDFHLDSSSSAILGNPDPGAWPSGAACFICGSNINDVSISGVGKIDGQGQKWWPNASEGRPDLVKIKGCNNLVFDGVTFQNSPMFHLVPQSCNNVIIRNVKILAPPSPESHNTDGIDPTSVNGLHVYNSYIDVGDDNIAIKTDTKNVLVENNIFGFGHGCSIGSITGGTNSNITFRNITFTNTTAGVRIKTQPGCTGSITDIVYRDLTMNNVDTIVDINMFYTPGCGSAQTGISISDITIQNIQGTGSHVGHFNCSQYMPCKNIKLIDINVKGKDDTFLCANAFGTATNVQPASCLKTQFFGQKLKLGKTKNRLVD